MDEAIAILKLCADDFDGLEVHALYDGDRIEPYETVMTIEGDYTTFAHLETPMLGTLARRTLITTNVVHVLEAANGKPIIFMPARHDHHRVQTGDGYAAYVAGQVVGRRDRRHDRRAGVVVGRPRHRHRAARADRRRTAATPCSRRQKFADWAPPDMNVTVLVDFENDSVRTALDVADALGDRLWGVRLDTSESLVDRSLWDELGDFTPTGVNERLVWKVRDALDARGFERCASSSRAASRSTRSATFEEQRRARRRVRRRLVADPRLERLHRRHRHHRRRAVGEGRPALRPNPRLELVT